MPRFKVAHIREQQVDLIIIPLEDNFEFKTEHAKRSAISELQLKANNAGLAGTVVPVWIGMDGRMKFYAPTNWHAFFSSIDMDFVLDNINRELYW